MKLKEIKYPSDELWNQGVKIISILHSSGFEAFFVGGCVRDILLGITPDDYDIATSARPKEVLKLFPDAGTIGIRFGVLTIDSDHGKCQVATFRRDDPKSDGRRPDRIFFSDLQGDSQRRDFTINSIYLNPLELIYVDPNKGVDDLQNKILRIIGNPMIRLREDHLRILRAIRFAARFNLQIEENTLEAIKKSVSLLKNISPDRIRDELTRTFSDENKVFALELLHKTGILPILWTKFSTDAELYLQSIASLASLQEISETSVWTAFFLPWGKYLNEDPDSIENALRRLNLSKRNKKEILKNINLNTLRDA